MTRRTRNAVLPALCLTFLLGAFGRFLGWLDALWRGGEPADPSAVTTTNTVGEGAGNIHGLADPDG